MVPDTAALAENLNFVFTGLFMGISGGKSIFHKLVKFELLYLTNEDYVDIYIEK